jgi:hypothetical protein
MERNIQSLNEGGISLINPNDGCATRKINLDQSKGNLREIARIGSLNAIIQRLKA